MNWIKSCWCYSKLTLAEFSIGINYYWCFCNGAGQGTTFQKVFFFQYFVPRSSTLHAGTSSLVFVQESGGERSVTTADIVVNDMSVVQFDVSRSDHKMIFEWERRYLKYNLNKKVLLREERKRHTARRVASTCYAVPLGGGGYLP